MGSLIPVFDTNVFIDIAKGRIDIKDWRKVKKRLPVKGSPLSAGTCIELLVGLDEEHFGAKQEAINVAYESCKGRVLPPPALFLWGIFHGVKHPNAAQTQRQLSSSLRAASQAGSMNQLIAEGVPFNTTAYGHKSVATVDLNWLKRQHNKSQTDFVDLLIQRKNEMWDEFGIRGLGNPSPQWESLSRKSNHEIEAGHWKKLLVSDLIDSLKIDAAGPDHESISSLIDASATLSQKLLHMLVLGGLNLTKHASIRNDIFQLLYLADERHCFVTTEEKLPVYVFGSTQSERILKFNEFLAST